MNFPALAHENDSDPQHPLQHRAQRWLQPVPDETNEQLLGEIFGEDPDSARRPELQRISSPVRWWPWARVIWKMAEAMAISYMFCLCLAIVASSVLIAWRTGDAMAMPSLLLTGLLVALLGIPGVRRFGVWGRAEVEASLARRYG